MKKFKRGQIYFRKSPSRKKSGHSQMLQVFKVFDGPDEYNNYEVVYYAIKDQMLMQRKTKLFNGPVDWPSSSDDLIVPINEATKADLKRFIISIFKASRFI